jgi:hypothetical protein
MLFTDLVESSLGGEDSDVAIVSCTSTHDDVLLWWLVVGKVMEGPEMCLRRNA